MSTILVALYTTPTRACRVNQPKATRGVGNDVLPAKLTDPLPRASLLQPGGAEGGRAAHCATKAPQFTTGSRNQATFCNRFIRVCVSTSATRSLQIFSFGSSHPYRLNRGRCSVGRTPRPRSRISTTVNRRQVLSPSNSHTSRVGGGIRYILYSADDGRSTRAFLQTATLPNDAPHTLIRLPATPQT